MKNVSSCVLCLPQFRAWGVDNRGFVPNVLLSWPARGWFYVHSYLAFPLLAFLSLFFRYHGGSWEQGGHKRMGKMAKWKKENKPSNSDLLMTARLRTEVSRAQWCQVNFLYFKTDFFPLLSIFFPIFIILKRNTFDPRNYLLSLSAAFWCVLFIVQTL